MKKLLTLVFVTITACTLMACTGGKTEVSAESTIEGTVFDATMNNVILQADDGNTYIFVTTDAEMDMGEEGLLIDERIKITYKGDLPADEHQSATAVKLELLQ